jgi:hypothetical protein
VHWEITNFCGKSQGKGTLSRHRRRWEDNIKMHVKNMGCEGIDWIKVDHNR